MHDVVPLNEVAKIDQLEDELFALREAYEVIWLKIGGILSTIVDEKLYRLRQDEEGNYFRTAESYMKWLDRRFADKGWSASRTTLYRWMADYRLFSKKMEVPEEDLLLLGRTNLATLAVGVHALEKEGRHEEARTLVTEVVEAAKANDGLPIHEVSLAVDDAIGRIMKSLDIEFTETFAGFKLKRLTLWWDHQPHNVLTESLSPAQTDWVKKRLGVTT